MKELELMRKLLKDYKAADWRDHLETLNLHTVFDRVYRSGYALQTANAIVAYIIYAYNNVSTWIDIRADRYENKTKILEGLGLDPNGAIWDEIRAGSNEVVQDVALSYLQIQPDWRWTTIMTCFDYHAKMMRFASEDTKTKRLLPAKKDEGGNDAGEVFEFFDMDTVLDTNKKKGTLIEEAIKKRKMGEELLKEIQSEYVNLDGITESEFGFKATKTFDIMSWRDFIRGTKKIEAR